MRRHAASVLIAFAAATAIMGAEVSSVSAECTFNAPWPEITPAVPTAREIVVGDVVTDATNAELGLGEDQEDRAYALRITHVLRGDAREGDLIDIQFMLANWPQTHYTGADGPSPSCAYVRATPGEVIALAFDALHPGGPMSDNKEEWIQPPTRYNAVGVIKGPGGNYGAASYRQRVTLDQLRLLASLPPTDTEEATGVGQAIPGGLPWLLVASLTGLAIGVRQFRARGGSGTAGGAG